MYLGLPLVPPFLSPVSIVQNALRGLNYASAAAGILEETGQHFVSIRSRILYTYK